MNELRMVVLDANRTEDQSTENLAAVLNIFQRIVNESVVLDSQVSSSPYYLSIVSCHKYNDVNIYCVSFTQCTLRFA